MGATENLQALGLLCFSLISTIYQLFFTHPITAICTNFTHFTYFPPLKYNNAVPGFPAPRGR
jgi:hypothetical protein